MTMTNNIEQRVLTNDERADILKDWYLDHILEYVILRDRWRNFVNPMMAYESCFHPFFNEHLFYECADINLVCEDGLTIAKHAAMNDPSLSDWINNEVWTRIRVLDWMDDGKTTHVVDLFTNEEFDLVDENVWQHRNWCEGSLGTRITRVGDTYYVAGDASLHDNSEKFDRDLYPCQNRFSEEVAFVIGCRDDSPSIFSVEQHERS